ncbi:valine--tRNA ligase [Candidatus Acetothermia bacterium]|nr:valine--tRNA ligase [Candidatus Acetothermia bacterium]
MTQSYDFKHSESAWAKFWDEQRLYEFNPKSEKPVYSIDTPPPTVSGNLHIGHCFSYTQADTIARFWRMRGCEVFYPFGFDDNGLPTERFVEKFHGIQARSMKRKDFIRLCLETVQAKEREFEQLWRRLGLSVDWTRCYSTISPSAQKISQRSFLDLYKKSRIYKKEAPALWCPYCRTAIAQAELEDREASSFFTDIAFTLESGEHVTISTTRPELLPACVALFAHPEDKRYKHLIGQRAHIPIFAEKIPILADAKVDREKGTGLVMCCTFGDTTDIAWWSEHRLPLKVALGQGGRMTAIAGPYNGLTAKEASKKIIHDLETEAIASNKREITHTVNVHERCGSAIELLVIPQWFIKVLDLKEVLLKAGEEIEWVPEFMKKRYIHWVENLKWDWCISRQRIFGVPFPLWTCANCKEITLAREDQLPVDPRHSAPSACPHCGSAALEPENEVFDTWATSSVTPQINAHWGESDELKNLMPMSLRPQAHEIIRTWAFYTIVKSLIHTEKIPWKRTLISGWVLADQGGKISKSKGGGSRDPIHLMETKSADAIRYWACRSKPGVDTTFSEDLIAQGKRLVTKLWNASKFALTHLTDYDGTQSKLETIDCWLLSKLAQTIEQATESFEACDYSQALAIAEKFFWHDLCDNYLEIIKKRLYNQEIYGRASRRAAQSVLSHSLKSTLKLLAPILPFITEEIFQQGFAKQENTRSIHISAWPQTEQSWHDREAEEIGDLAIAIVESVRKEKSLKKLSLAAPVQKLEIIADAQTQIKLQPVLSAIQDVTQAQELSFALSAQNGALVVMEGLKVSMRFLV